MPRNWQKRVGKSAAAQEKFIKQKFDLLEDLKML